MASKVAMSESRSTYALDTSSISETSSEGSEEADSGLGSSEDSLQRPELTLRERVEMQHQRWRRVKEGYIAFLKSEKKELKGGIGRKRYPTAYRKSRSSYRRLCERYLYDGTSLWFLRDKGSDGIGM